MDIINFTPLSATVGGLLIGTSAALLLLMKGRVAGISGISGGVILPEEEGDTAWRVVFIAGLIIGGLIYRLLSGDSSEGLFKGVEHIAAVVDWPMLVVGGALVGIGSTIGSGCTSGHGICGLARRSPRSLAATLTFMTAGFVAVYVVRQVMGS